MTQTEPDGHDRVAFIGGGNMTRAIVLGMLRNAYPPGHIFISEPDADRRRQPHRAVHEKGMTGHGEGGFRPNT